MVRNRKLAKAISETRMATIPNFDTERRSGEKYGREFRVINRWEPTSHALQLLWFPWWQKRIKC